MSELMMDTENFLSGGARTLVVKVGSAVLVGGAQGLERGAFCRLVEMLAGLLSVGHRVVLVTSGAVAMGRRKLGILTKPRGEAGIPVLQALAALGQSQLIQHYESEFAHYGYHVAQLLLTRDDFHHRRRFLNARLALEAVHRLGAVPVINENDTVATDEIKVGDNDQLAALVATLIGADRVVLLSDIDGLYDADPRSNPEARRLPVVRAFDPGLDPMVGDTHGGAAAVGTGGMRTKLLAARIAARSGIPLIVAPGRRPGVLPEVLQGTSATGTLFVPEPGVDRLVSREAWIGLGARAQGRLWCDDGARRAVLERGASLLPSGVLRVEGDFSEGDVVELVNGAGVAFARGLAISEADAVRRIAGAQSAQIEALLGYHVLDAVVHRDNLVLLASS